MLWLGYIILLGTGVGVFILSMLMTKCLLRKEKDSQILTILTVAISLTLSVLALFLIPVDVYNVSTLTNKDGIFLDGIDLDEANTRSTTIRISYWIIILLMAIVGFVLIPFSYCYYEESGDEEASCCTKSIRSMKFVIVSVLIVAIIIIVSLFVNSSPKDAPPEEWIDNLFDSKNGGQSSIDLCISILMLFGTLFWIVIEPCGMNILSIGLLGVCSKSKDKSDEDTLLLKRRINKEKERTITAKYADRGGRSASMSKKDKKTLGKLDRDSNEINETLHDRRTEGTNKPNCCLTLLYNCSLPFRILFGIVFFIVSLFIVVCMVFAGISRIVKLVNKTEWVVTQVGQPMDYGFVAMSKVFPVDFIIFFLIFAFIFICMLSAFLSLGIGCPCCLLFRITVRKTRQQAVLLMALMMMFMSLAFLGEIPFLLPQYYTFGGQTYRTYENVTNSSYLLSSSDSSFSSSSLSLPSSSSSFSSSSEGSLLSLIDEISTPPTVSLQKKIISLIKSSHSSSFFSSSSSSSSSSSFSSPPPPYFLLNQDNVTKVIHKCSRNQTDIKEAEEKGEGFCFMTELSKIMSRIFYGMAFFDYVFLFAMFFFAVVYFISMMYYWHRACAGKPVFLFLQKAMEGGELDDDFDEEDEKGSSLFARGKYKKRAEYNDYSSLKEKMERGEGAWAMERTASMASNYSNSGDNRSSSFNRTSSGNEGGNNNNSSSSSSSSSSYGNDGGSSASSSYNNNNNNTPTYTSATFNNDSVNYSSSNSAYGGLGDGAW